MKYNCQIKCSDTGEMVLIQSAIIGEMKNNAELYRLFKNEEFPAMKSHCVRSLKTLSRWLTKLKKDLK